MFYYPHDEFSLVIGMVALGLFAWEVLLRDNGGSLPVWALLVPGFVQTYIGVQALAGDYSGVEEPSWWLFASWASVAVGWLPYAVFRVKDRLSGW